MHTNYDSHDYAVEVRNTLSPAENRVYDLVLLGKKNKEIADDICRTEKTVKFHLTNIYRKLGLKSRSQLIANHFNTAA